MLSLHKNRKVMKITQRILLRHSRRSGTLAAVSTSGVEGIRSCWRDLKTDAKTNSQGHTNIEVFTAALQHSPWRPGFHQPLHVRPGSEIRV